MFINRMEILYLIPARGGSKGIPGKNIKLLQGKPLICYSIDTARGLSSDENICVTTDDKEIKKVCEDYGLKVPFLRPEYLATDEASSYDVIKHAVGYFQSMGKKYDAVVLLQPTSPLRTSDQIKEAQELYTPDIEMIVSVKETKSNPYYVLFEEDPDGFLFKSKTLDVTRRQDCPKVWEYNGAIYIINVNSLMENNSFANFKRIRKYVMDEQTSIDIDSPFDWMLVEFYLSTMFNKVQ